MGLPLHGLNRMIFSRILTPPHKSKDPAKRIRAVEGLSAAKPADKSVLHELAFNDADADVSLAALHKLNSFALWQKMSQIARNDKVQRTARAKVESALFQSEALNDAERKAFLLESAPVELILRVLDHHPALVRDHSFIRQLVNKVGRDSFTERVLVAADDAGLTRSLLANESDTRWLTRLNKKLHNADSQAFIEAQLTAIRAEQDRPVQLERDATLVLSKLWALIEKNDFPSVQEQHQALTREFEQLADSFACLDAESQAELNGKYRRIEAQVSGHLDTLAPQWRQQQEAERSAQAINAAQAALIAAREAVDWLYQTRLHEATLAEVETVSNTVRQLEQQSEVLAASQPESVVRKKILAAQQALTKQLDDFSAQQQQAVKALEVLEKVEAMTTGERSYEQDYLPLATRWRELTAVLHTIPDDWQRRMRDCQQHWQHYNDQHKAETQQAVKQCRKHLNAMDNLVSSGRYRAAMGRFDKLRTSYQALPEAEQQRLRKRYTQAEEAVSRLAGWQHYLAAPRRPELITQAKELAASPVTNVHERAETIRYLRKQWQSLSLPGNEDDTDTATFNAVLEEAFVPCREYYAQQARQREQAAEQRHQLVTAARDLAGANAEDVAELAARVDKLRQQWRQAGNIERKHYQQLKDAFEQALLPAQQRVDDWYQQNRQTKQRLVEQVKALSAASEPEQAAHQAQQLQQQWKAVGHAGRRHETKLWQAFREANDGVFAVVKEQRQQQRQAGDASLKAWMRKASSLSAEISASSLNASNQKLQILTDELRALPDAVQQKGRRKLAGITQQLADLERQQQAQQQRQKYLALAELIRQVANGDAGVPAEHPQWHQLDKQWQRHLRDGGGDELSRHQLTVALEMALSRTTPEQDTDVRLALQLAQLSARLERGERWSADSLISAWLAHGLPTESEHTLTTRFMQCLAALAGVEEVKNGK